MHVYEPLCVYFEKLRVVTSKKKSKKRKLIEKETPVGKRPFLSVNTNKPMLEGTTLNIDELGKQFLYI